MKRKIIYGIVVFIILLLIVGAGVLYKMHRSAAPVPPPPPALQTLDAQEQAIAHYAIAHLKRMERPIEHYIKHPSDLPKSDILLEEILKLYETDLSHGEWDETLGVYTTPHFIYIGGCYSDWCYVEANRKGNIYSLYIRHNGNAWSEKSCATQKTEPGRKICQYLKKLGWTYVDGEV